MPGDFAISRTGGRPLYLQLIEQIKQKIAVGNWERGAEIPSLRQLTVALSVSIITIRRAYSELERDSVILTHQGRGSFVALKPDLDSRWLEEKLTAHLEQAAQLGSSLGCHRAR